MPRCGVCRRVEQSAKFLVRVVPGSGAIRIKARLAQKRRWRLAIGSQTQDTGPRVIEQSRNTLQQQVIILRVESNDSHIVSVIHDDVRKNGPTRNLIVETAAA